MNASLTLVAIFGILVSHYVADFVAQAHWMAKTKSQGITSSGLWAHVAIYTLLVAVFVSIVGAIDVGAVGWDSDNPDDCFGRFFAFIGITFVCHWFTDYASSPVTSALWKAGAEDENRIHDFFAVVGLDQLLHYTQLIFTYYLCFVK